MSLFQRGKFWWYEFWFAGRRIQESSKSTSKSVAKLAEQKRRRELEEGFNSIEDQRQEQVRTLRDTAKAYLESYTLRNRSATFAEYAIKHLNEHLGDRMLFDVNENTIREYQDARLTEKAAPKTINEEVGFLLRLLGDRGEVIRGRLKKIKQLKLKARKGVGKAFSVEEKARLLTEARRAQSPNIYPVLMLALNAGIMNDEIRSLKWENVDFTKNFLTVSRSKTEAGEDHTIPLTPDLRHALEEHALWCEVRFGSVQPDWFLFPAWGNVHRRSGIHGRLHDSRHTLITELAESGAGDQTIKDIAGHVSPQMLKHYSHIRMQANGTSWRRSGGRTNRRPSLAAVSPTRSGMLPTKSLGRGGPSPYKSPYIRVSGVLAII